MDERQAIWNYQQGLDTHASFAAFRYFLAQPPPRSLNAVCIGTEFNLNTVRGWSSACYWFERAAAWDDYIARIQADKVREIVERTAEERAAKQLTTIEKLHTVLDHEVSKLFAQSMASGVTTLNPSQIMKLAELAIKLERLVRGDSTENVREQVDLTQLSDEELRALDSMMGKAVVK